MCAAQHDSNLSTSQGQAIPNNYREDELLMDVVGAGTSSQRAKLAGGGEI